MKKGSSKKKLSLLLLSLMMINVLASSVIATDVGYIYKNENKIDENVVEVFEDKGLSVELIDEDDLPIDFNGYKFLFVGDERFRHEDKIPIWDFPTIVSNYYFGEEFGFTDSDGVSQLASSQPLNVLKDNRVVQVYTQALFSNSISIPYYFLSNENILPGSDSVAKALSSSHNGDVHLLGDVVSFAKSGTQLKNGEEANEKICFFGIIESDYWTSTAEDLFQECVDYVGLKCDNDNECPDRKIGESYCLDGDVYQNVEEFSCVNPGTYESACVDDIVSEFVKNCGGSCDDGECVCFDSDNDGYDECNPGTEGDDGLTMDCNDNNSGVKPGLAEMCDGIDNNCNGLVDEGCPVDNDGDGFDNSDGGFGDDGKPIDCNDNDAQVNPDAFEICDGIDNDCNLIIDEGCCSDSDDDGYDNCNIGDFGDDGKLVDCRDLEDDVHPNAQEICDGKDNDCDNVVDENNGYCSQGNVCSFGSCVLDCMDGDGDGYDNCDFDMGDDDGKPIDCNDNDVNVYPGSLEICDNKDNNCNGLVDENNGYCSEGSICTNGQCLNVDCNDDLDCGVDTFLGNSFCTAGDSYQEFVDYTCVNPGTVGSYCDSLVSDVLVDGCVSGEVCLSGMCAKDCVDNDLDGYDDCNVGENEEDDDGKLLDCDDSNNNVYPNAFEICDNRDNDCDGQIDESNGHCSEGSICTNGLCEEIRCDRDSDCGVSGFIDGLYCNGFGNEDVYQNYIEYSCENPGSVSSSCTQEVDSKLVTECNGGCEDGMCVSIVCEDDRDCNDNNDGTEDVCNNPGTVLSYCTYEGIECNSNSDCDDHDVYTQDSCVNAGGVDSYCNYEDIVCFSNSECGMDGFIDGLYCNGFGNEDVYQNYIEYSCENPGSVSSSCTQEVSQELVTNCQDSCSEGSCVSIVCEDSSDCNDFRSDTIDSCINPGELDSYCTYDEIACQSNSDCGFDRFTGGLFCQGDDLYRNFIDYSCNLAGGENSFCSNEIDGVFLHSCTYACSDGNCVRCSDDNYCDDDNENTVDSCNFPGSVNSYCSHEEIRCNNDLECGVDGFVGDSYCISDDVYRNYETNICTNDGSVDSSCSDDTTPVLIEECLFDCNNGVCEDERECSNGEDDDNDGLIDALDPGCWDDISDPNTYNPNLNDEGRTDAACLTDLDCAFDITLELYCDGNNYYQDVTVPACFNAGTGVSYCGDEIFTELVDECASNEVCVDYAGCIQVTCNQDSDCGEDGFSGSAFCSDGNGVREYNEYTCSNPGTLLSYCSVDTTNLVVDDCNGGEVCSNGMCIDDCVDNDNDGYDNCNPGEGDDDGRPLDCNDNDNGVNPGVNDQMCNGVDNNCNGLIDEEYIVSGTSCGVGECSANGLLDCVNGVEVDSCNEGTPSEEMCDGLDNNCDGNIDEAGDLCSEGSICLFGSCTAIACDENSDCGTDGFIGNEFCTNEGISQNYQTFICSNPGEITSSCANSVEPQIKEVCEFACSSGECIGECNVDSDCGDDFYSSEYCSLNNVVRDLHDLGCIDHICVEEIIAEDVEMCSDLCEDGLCVDVECNENSDCGTDGFIGNAYCNGDELVQDFNVNSCLNPGTVSSSCLLSIDEVTLEVCSAGCANGACLVTECNDGVDNDDDNKIDNLDPGCFTDQNNPSTYDPELNDESADEMIPQCDDGVDNDNDNLIDAQDNDCWTDYNDPNTYDPNDDLEGTPQCDDGVDNEGDTRIDVADPGCWNEENNPSSYNPNLDDEGADGGDPQCSDGVDNDNDFSIDENDADCWDNPNDPSTYNPENPVEGKTECEDNTDNDNDGLINQFDPGCWTDQTDPNTYDPSLDDEGADNGNAQCNDGVDNDNDGNVDEFDDDCWADPNDPNTYDPNDDLEGKPQCSNNIDDDLDLDTDEADNGCWMDSLDSSTYNPLLDDEGIELDLQCSDGIDNDNDNLIDDEDYSCWADPLDSNTYDPTLDDEGRITEICDNGIDDDGDGKTDGPNILDVNNGEQESFGGLNNIYTIPGLVNQHVVDKDLQVNHVPNVIRRTAGSWDVNTHADHATLDKVCEIFGYDSVVSSSCNSAQGSGCNFHSPGNNIMYRWDGNNFVTVSAWPKYGNSWLTQITCKDRLAACNDGVDNDNDGLVDMADDGCSEPQDDDERPNDDVCIDLTCPDVPECSDGVDNDNDLGIDFGDVEVNFDGSSNPSNSGFVMNLRGPSSTIPVGVVNEFGETAWKVDDNGNGAERLYFRDLTNSEKSNALNGWRYKSRVRVVDVMTSLPNIGSVDQQIVVNGRSYRIFLGKNNNGDPIVHRRDVVGAISGPVVTLNGYGEGYHDYEIVYDGNTDSADLLVDGNMIMENFKGASYGSNIGSISFGSAATTGGGHGNYANIEFRTGGDPDCLSADQDFEDSSTRTCREL